MRDLAYYRLLPYNRLSEPAQNESGSRYWVVWIEEIPECKADGKTITDAMSNLDLAFDDYIEAMLEFSSEIAVPKCVNVKESASVEGNPEYNWIEAKPDYQVEISNPSVKRLTSPMVETFPQQEAPQGEFVHA